MARAPNSADVDQVQLRNTRDVVQVPGSPVIEARSRFAGAVQEVVGRIADQENELAANRADLEAARELESIRQRYETDDDWQTAPDRARVEAQAVLAARGAGLRGEATQRAWSARSMERLGQFESVVRRQSRERGVSLARAEIIRFGEEAEATAGDLTQPEDVRRLAATNYAAALARAEERGFYDPEQVEQLTVQFGDRVRQRVTQGLEAEWVQRLERDPDDLAAEIEAGEADWGAVQPDTRARWVREARQAGARAAVNDALQEALRTGQVVREDDPRLADRWSHLGEGARLSYAAQASTAVNTHRAAAALGELSGLSLAEIAVRADQATAAGGSGGGGAQGAAARALIRAAERDPVSYVIGTQPVAQAARDRMIAARRAAAGADATPDARAEATAATMEYGMQVLQLQDAVGVSRSDQRLYPTQQTASWAARIRSLPLDRQQATIQALPDQLIEMWGDQNLAERALAEHMQAYVYAQPAPGNAPPPDPATSAGQGASYDAVRQRLLRLVEIGAGLDSAEAMSMVNALTPADRARLATDPEIARALGMPVEGQ